MPAVLRIINFMLILFLNGVDQKERFQLKVMSTWTYDVHTTVQMLLGHFKRARAEKVQPNRGMGHKARCLYV